MRNVGYPSGFPISRDQIRNRLECQGRSVFNQLLVAIIRSSGEAIGECKLAHPDQDGVSEPDIKLLPEHWGKGYGRELWDGIVAYQFENTDCAYVQTTPKADNIAAIKIYETAGAVRVGEDTYIFPPDLEEITSPVHHYIYRLSRITWEKRHPDM